MSDSTNKRNTLEGYILIALSIIIGIGGIVLIGNAYVFFTTALWVEFIMTIVFVPVVFIFSFCFFQLGIGYIDD